MSLPSSDADASSASNHEEIKATCKLQQTFPIMTVSPPVKRADHGDLPEDHQLKRARLEPPETPRTTTQSPRQSTPVHGGRCFIAPRCLHAKRIDVLAVRHADCVRRVIASTRGV
jgi:hypothetical protein